MIREGYCQHKVYVPDTYRVSHGRTWSGRSTKAHFSMHYKEQQCSRKIGKAALYCWQHKRTT